MFILSLGHELFVVRLFPTSLRILNLIVLPLKAASFFLVPHLLFHEVLGPVFSIDTTRIPFRRAFNHRADL